MDGESGEEEEMKRDAWDETSVKGCDQADGLKQETDSKAFVRGTGDMAPVTAASFATENAPKCTISRVKILFVAKCCPPH